LNKYGLRLSIEPATTGFYLLIPMRYFARLSSMTPAHFSARILTLVASFSRGSSISVLSLSLERAGGGRNRKEFWFIEIDALLPVMYTAVLSFERDIALRVLTGIMHPDISGTTGWTATKSCLKSTAVMCGRKVKHATERARGSHGIDLLMRQSRHSNEVSLTSKGGGRAPEDFF